MTRGASESSGSIQTSAYDHEMIAWIEAGTAFVVECGLEITALPIGAIGRYLNLTAILSIWPNK